MLVKQDADVAMQMAIDGLDSESALLHLSGIAWLYAQERDSCDFPEQLARFGVAPFWEQAQAELVAARLVEVGYWTRCADGGYELIDHADVIRQEIAAYRKKAIRNRDSVARKRSGVNATVIARDGGKCRACGTTANLTVDHVFPQAQGGCRELPNLQTLCQPCNSGKGARVADGVACCGLRTPRCGDVQEEAS